MAPAMPCKTSKNSQHGATRGKSNEIKSKLACILKPVNPQECVWKNLNQIIMRTILQEEGTIHYNIIIWYTNLFLCLKQRRYPQQKQQWIKNGRNLKRFRRGTWRKSEVKKKDDRWSKDEGRKSSFCLTDGYLSFEECRIRGKAPKIRGFELYS